jgi:RNA polymerase sigma factor (sigma-70 family)
MRNFKIEYGNSYSGLKMDHLKLKLMDLQSRLNNWQFSKLWYLDSYDDPSQEKIIVSQIPDYDLYLERKAKTIEAKKDQPPEFLFMYMEPILTYEQQQHLFRQYNFFKYKYKQLAEHGDFKQNQFSTVIRNLENYSLKMREAKHKLICSNARVVMNLTKKANVPNLEVGLSDGYLGLTMAVDYFDFRKGIKFITYCYVVVRDYIRKNRLGEIKSAAFTNADEFIDWELTAANINVEDDAANLERISAVANSLKRIPERERDVISYYYGLVDGREHTLDEIGRKMCISKERVRQIRTAGLERIRRIGTLYGQTKESQIGISL